MRSYSTVLCHVLASNPEIVGYSEMHLSYTQDKDFISLLDKVYKMNNERLEGAYVLDKILHEYEISDSVLLRENVSIIFLVRSPTEAIKSILHMGYILGTTEWYKDLEQVVRYYMVRLQTIMSYAMKIRRKGIFIEAEKIVSHTDDVLAFLSEKLALQEILASEYETFSYTGVAGFGDYSSRIKKGIISHEKNDYSDIVLPVELLRELDGMYKRCCDALRKTCITMNE